MLRANPPFRFRMEPENLRSLIACGQVAIPANINHKALSPEGIGTGLKTKINVNLGISGDCKNYDVEMQKVNMRKNWTKLMDKYGIDVVLNGHDHYYTRSFQMSGGSPVNTVKTNAVTNPKGTVYFTLDSGSGSKYYKYNTTKDHSFSAFGWQNNVPTYTYAKVTDNTFSLTTYATNSDKAIDTYTITKAKATPVAQTGKTSEAAVTSPKTGDNNGSDIYLIFTIAAGAFLIAAGCFIVIKKRKANQD